MSAPAWMSRHQSGSAVFVAAVAVRSFVQEQSNRFRPPKLCRRCQGGESIDVPGVHVCAWFYEQPEHIQRTEFACQHEGREAVVQRRAGIRTGIQQQPGDLEAPVLGRAHQRGPSLPIGGVDIRSRLDKPLYAFRIAVYHRLEEHIRKKNRFPAVFVRRGGAAEKNEHQGWDHAQKPEEHENPPKFTDLHFYLLRNAADIHLILSRIRNLCHIRPGVRGCLRINRYLRASGVPLTILEPRIYH
jgi:hypothetical protein